MKLDAADAGQILQPLDDFEAIWIPSSLGLWLIQGRLNITSGILIPGTWFIIWAAFRLRNEDDPGEEIGAVGEVGFFQQFR